MSDEKVKKDVAVSGPKLNLQKYTAPFEEMERMFNDFLQQRFWGQSWMPRMRFPESTDVSTSIDMFEDGNELVIKADIPGMKKEDIKIDLSDNVLSISGEKKSEEKTEQKDYYRVERSFGAFNRKLHLPVEVQVDQAKASFKDGVLEIRMPKSESEKAKVRKITVE